MRVQKMSVVGSGGGWLVKVWGESGRWLKNWESG